MRKFNISKILKGYNGLQLLPIAQPIEEEDEEALLTKEYMSKNDPLLGGIISFGEDPSKENATALKDLFLSLSPEQQSHWAQNPNFSSLISNINDASLGIDIKLKNAIANQQAIEKALATNVLNVGDLTVISNLDLLGAMANDPKKMQHLESGLGLGVAAVNAIDQGTMGDKNFGSQSAAIDTGVHMASSALMKSGNPYAMAAGAALEVGNFLTKATGQTVEGFDVNLDNSGYGNLGHMESKSNRDFLSLIGLGGLNQGKINRQLANRNELAQMALKASNISDTIKFELEARMNSVDDVLRQNEIALRGGLDTSLLAAKKGAKLLRLEDYAFSLRYKIKSKPKQVSQEKETEDSEITKAKNGAKLKNIETSEEPNVIPSGTLHKNKHADFDLDVTKKGIPVVTVKDDSAETLEDIQEQKETLVQHAEVEKEEIILEKNLTEFIEDKKKEWEKTNDDQICVEVGMRFVKELLFNTEDNSQTIKQTKLKENE